MAPQAMVINAKGKSFREHRPEPSTKRVSAGM